MRASPWNSSHAKYSRCPPPGSSPWPPMDGRYGSLSTYDPLGNAKAAVIISANGTNWHPLTTFTSGAYRGRC